MPSLSPTSPNSVFDKDEHYNRIVSRQIARSASEQSPEGLYASIPEDFSKRHKSGRFTNAERQPDFSESL